MNQRFEDVFSVDAGKGTWRKFASCILRLNEKINWMWFFREEKYWILEIYFFIKFHQKRLKTTNIKNFCFLN